MDVERRREQELHQAVVEGRRWASDDLIEHFHPRLFNRLKADFAALRDDPELEECVLQALLEYVLQPYRYQPHRASLWTFLYTAARRDALNLTGKRHRQLELPLDAEKIAAEPSTRKEGVEEEALRLVPGLPDDVSFDDLRARLRASLKPPDHPIVDLVLAEHAPFDCFVRALQLEGVERKEQERLVKRAKDRVHAAKQRLEKRVRDG
ncbi:MAG TPA: hypothetical protein VK689_02450 [Armatimonadota bacterium]|nr:hypothetical protein [Armatimonadota bacterium]